MNETFTASQQEILKERFGIKFHESPEFQRWWVTAAQSGLRKENAISDLRDDKFEMSRKKTRAA